MLSLGLACLHRGCMLIPTSSCCTQRLRIEGINEPHTHTQKNGEGGNTSHFGMNLVFFITMEEDVLWFDISMQDSCLMDVTEALCYVQHQLQNCVKTDVFPVAF